MPARIFDRSRELWLPALVAALGAVLSLAVWGYLIADRRERVSETAREVAEESRWAIGAALETRVIALRELAQQWARVGPRAVDEWRGDVDILIESFPGLLLVAWIAPDGIGHRVTAGSSDASLPGDIDPEAARRFGAQPALRGPVRSQAGAAELRVYLPVEAEGEDLGVLEARLDLGAFLDGVLRGVARGYAIAIRWEGELIFSRGKPTSDPWQRWWRAEGGIDLPLGGRWHVLHRPTPELAAAQLTPIPHYLLAGGLLLSLVLGVLAHQLRLTQRQAESLAAGNRALATNAAELRALNEELERRVAERTGELEDAVAELEAFNYSVSHDLRSPLGAILNVAAVLEEDYRDRVLDADGLALLARIVRSATRGTVLLEDLLRLSSAGRVALELAPIEMTALARETFAQARAVEGEPEVDFLLEPLPEAMGDRSLVGDVLVNLFSNALKYSRGRDKRRISVRGRAGESECIYEVADNGQGFDMRFAPKLFGLFERLHACEEIEGTGVGLAIVQRIVKRHGGRVWAESEIGCGARFAFTLPRSGAPS